jgi:hypothetical protein
MGDIDFKQIGLAAKDIVIGISAAAAGASGGAPAAEGVMKAGSGIDKIVDLAVPADKKQSRAEKFDRADFDKRKPSTAPATPQSPAGTGTAQAQAQASPPVDVDAKTTADYLAARGWPPEKVQQILRGPGVTGENSLASIVGKEVDGSSVRMTSGSAVELKNGAAVEAVAGSPVATVPGEAQRMVAGAVVKGTAGTDSA